MLLTSHTFVGVAIATSIPNPYISVPLSFIMHFIGDKVPHWDFYSNTQKEERVKGWRPMAVMADFGLGIVVGLTFTFFALWVRHDSTLALNIFLSGIASVLPDALEAPYIFMDKEGEFVGFIRKIQHKMQFQAPLPWGIISQVIVIAFSLLLVSNSILLK